MFVYQDKGYIINMSKYDIIFEYGGKDFNVKCNDFNSLKSEVEKKSGVSLIDHRLEYHNPKHNKWIGIFADDDLENVTEQTEVRLIPKDKGKNI